MAWSRHRRGQRSAKVRRARVISGGLLAGKPGDLGDVQLDWAMPGGHGRWFDHAEKQAANC
jgi:hypothetical protein